MPLDTLEREILERIERKVDNLDKEWKDSWREASEKYHEFVVETIKTEGRLTSDISGIRGTAEDRLLDARHSCGHFANRLGRLDCNAYRLGASC